MVLGYFGKTPVAPDPEIVELASKQLGKKPTTRPALEMNDEDPTKGIEPARKALADEGLEITDENIFIAAACKEKGIRFLKGEAEVGVRKIDRAAEAAAAAPAPSGARKPAEYNVTVDGKDYFMAFEGNMATVNGKAFRVDIKTVESGSAAPEEGGTATQVTAVKSQMPGAVFKVLVSAGDRVAEGQAVLILEAMKMEMEISAPIAGTIAAVNVAVGEQVATGQILASINA